MQFQDSLFPLLWPNDIVKPLPGTLEFTLHLSNRPLAYQGPSSWRMVGGAEMFKEISARAKLKKVIRVELK